MCELKRAKIIVKGLVQGVGYRYFVVRHAENLNLKGYTQNLFTGEVLIEVEGDTGLINDFIKQLNIGPSRSHVVDCAVDWLEYTGEFNSFNVRF